MQDTNASLPIVVRGEEIVISVNDEHPLNMLFIIIFIA